jgi:peroxiredoxin-like protein
MSEDLHQFHLQSVWKGNSQGDGTITVNGRTLDYGIPEALGGEAGRSNPEEMLLGAVASCYSMTLAILAERRRLPITQIDLACEGDVHRQPGGTLKYTAIRLAPTITMPGGDEAQVKAATDFAHKAEQYCVISNAIRGNVEVTVTPTIITD